MSMSIIRRTVVWILLLIAGIMHVLFANDPTKGCVNELLLQQKLLQGEPTEYEKNALVDQGILKQSLASYKYKPATSEQFVFDRMVEFGFDKDNNPLTCPAIKREEIKPSLDKYREELNTYYEFIEDFDPIDDLRLHLDHNHTICDKVDLVPGGLPEIFKSQQLSFTPSGYVEPILPPFRSMNICFESNINKSLMNLKYLVHDFGHMCRKLKKTSRNILIDIGASLQFHEKEGLLAPPIYLTAIYQKMGFKFDHIYAFEVAPEEPGKVFELVPKSLQSAYHWINIGVSSEKGAKNNPLTMLLNDFREDDLIVVKLDIDTGSIEVPLARQVLDDPRFAGLIDHFYFEHHMHMGELASPWGNTTNGTVKESIELFTGLREKGIASHYWP